MPISGYRCAWSDNEFSKQDAAGESFRLNLRLELVQFFCVGEEFFISKPDFSQVWAYFVLKHVKWGLQSYSYIQACKTYACWQQKHIV
jgi:hypothetical protein